MTADEELCPASLISFPYFLLFFNYLRPFSFSPKKKGQKERRRSAPVCVRETARTGRRSRFFHEFPQWHGLAIVTCVRIPPYGTSMLDGIAWKNPPHHREREGSKRKGVHLLAPPLHL